jgi:steroid 5-alpha reductase family enzyme
VTLLHAALWGFVASAALGAIVWLASIVRRNVGIVDIAWGWLVWLPAATVALLLPHAGPRCGVLLGLAGLWALRLAIHIARRQHGQPEDRRYQAIRRRNEPHFAMKSLYLVFGLQALLAWIVATPLMAGVASAAGWHALDAIGLAIFAFGVVFEAVADSQLTRFLADPAHRGTVMATGLWRYSRHPNYFGECCIWWGAWLVALATGAWWAIVSPLLMTMLLLKVSGVGLLERDIGERRPGYADYVRRTNAFVPGRPRA